MSKASRMGFDGLMERAAALHAVMERCSLCPRACGARRTEGETGFCGCTDALEIASSCIHTGEEPVLGGSVGVGNLFLAHCNMRCAFCQNHQISQTGRRFPVSVDDAARTMLGLRSAGCPTVGFVSPVQHLPMIVEAVAHAVRGGFDIPLIYNSNGYDSVEALRLLDGVFDIYLPDFKYAGEEMLFISLHIPTQNPGLLPYPAILIHCKHIFKKPMPKVLKYMPGSQHF